MSCNHSSQPVLAYRLSLVIDNHCAAQHLHQNNKSYPRLIILGYALNNISEDSIFLPLHKPSVNNNSFKLQLVYKGKSTPVRINTIGGSHFGNSGWIRPAETVFVNIVISSKELNNLCISEDTPAKHIAQHARLRYRNILSSESTYQEDYIKLLYYKTSIQYINEASANGAQNECLDPSMFGYY